MTKPLKELADTARTLANDLFHAEADSDDLVCSWQKADGNAPSCMTREERRELTKKEKADGWARPFYAYDPERMCAACQAYWYAELAAQTLHRMHCFKVREEAVKKSQQGS